MADDTDRKPLAEPNPNAQGGINASGSAHAPFLYFEAASAFGYLNGVIRITLEAQRIFPTRDDAAVGIDRVLVAHLTMNIPAALSLKAAIEAALLLASHGPTETKN